MPHQQALEFILKYIMRTGDGPGATSAEAHLQAILATQPEQMSPTGDPTIPEVPAK